jgi:hypothetical protein
MLRFLWRLLIVGWPKKAKCKHDWNYFKEVRFSSAVVYVYQCKKCKELKNHKVNG